MIAAVQFTYLGQAFFVTDTARDHLRQGKRASGLRVWDALATSAAPRAMRVVLQRHVSAAQQLKRCDTGQRPHCHAATLDEKRITTQGQLRRSLLIDRMNNVAITHYSYYYRWTENRFTHEAASAQLGSAISHEPSVTATKLAVREVRSCLRLGLCIVTSS